MTHQLWQSKAKFFFCYSLTMATQLFPLPLFFSLVQSTMDSSLWCVLSYWGKKHCFTGIYTLSKFTRLTAVVVYFTEVCGTSYIGSDFPEHSREHDKRGFLKTHLDCCFLCARGQQARSGGKRNIHCDCSGSVVDAYRATSILRGPCNSCINAFQDAGTWFTARLMDYFPSFLSTAVYILTLVSAEPDRSCWIGYLPFPQGHTATCSFVGFSEDIGMDNEMNFLLIKCLIIFKVICLISFVQNPVQYSP